METNSISLERGLKAIISLGLSDIDAQVYVFLAVNDPHKARDMTSKLSLYKKQFYRSFKNLQDKDVTKSYN